MQFRDCPAETLLGQFGHRFVQRRGLKRQLVRLGAIGLVGGQGLSRRHSEAFLAGIYPDREVGHPRRLIEPDVGQVSKSGSGGIKQCAKDSRSYLFEFAPELRLVAPLSGFMSRNSTISARSRKSGRAALRSGIALNTMGRVA
jgi:hypothetical protein